MICDQRAAMDAGVSPEAQCLHHATGDVMLLFTTRDPSRQRCLELTAIWQRFWLGATH